MNPELAIPVIWCLAGALLIKLRSAWSQLPERVAVHFGLNMQPDRWSSRKTMAVTVVLVMLGQAALATWLILRVGNVANMVAVVQLVVALVLVCVFWQMINFNARGSPLRPRWVFIPVVLLLATIAVLLLRHGV